MSKQERSIDYVYDNEERRIIDLDETITSQKDGFEIRNQYNSNTIRFTCVECGQNLVCANSSKDKIYFRHLPQATYCVLSDSELLNPDNNLLEAYKISAICKESPRHKELKNKLGNLLMKEPGVDINSIDIDSKFIFGSGGKRRPDVYCEYKGLKLAFEIQLSKLPLHYIKHRYDFYKKNGIYLIWITDLKSLPTNLDNYVRDIKFVWRDHNLFSIADHENDKLVFTCNYKQPFIHNNKEVHSKWIKKNISLNDLFFNTTEYYCYYYPFSLESIKKQEELTELEHKQARLAKQQQTTQQIEKTIHALLNKIKLFKEKGKDFKELWGEFEELYEDEKLFLNNRINWGKEKDGVPHLFYYIKNYKATKDSIGMNIVEFIISNPIFEYDVNMIDNNGNGILYYLYNNKELVRKVDKLEQFIVLRGYIPTSKDLEVLTKLFDKRGKGTYYILMYYSCCKSIHEMERVRRASGFLLFVESAKRMEIIGKNVNSWVQYMVFVIDNNKGLWQYIRHVLNKTSLGKELIKVDSKGTIKKRIKEHRLNDLSLNKTNYDIYVKIHPDLFKY
ncbi:hypothetical protein AV926_16175 [Myroides marinus]|uniref:Competence protein CoiA-like family protein n=1 Tax=Myroides marinus TaxID=703342 RepID=A0A161RXB5_9FLAO|nr:DUF6035 family protein [Myroides marinus]KZE76179.1 hypothetical protein AV926_16175 [Myroides marinus]